MEHIIIRIKNVIAIPSSYFIKVVFDDGIEKTVDLEPMLFGPLYGPLRDESIFEAVELDPETGIVQWPNGADFDPSTLYLWDEYKDELAERALSW